MNDSIQTVHKQITISGEITQASIQIDSQGFVFYSPSFVFVISQYYIFQHHAELFHIKFLHHRERERLM